jgi:cytochrome c oxidase subunit 3
MSEPVSKAYGLQHHFDSYEQQQEASYLGMWLFLVTEILFFGGVFAAYLVYRTGNPLAFQLGSNQLDLMWGTINTAVLIGSSLTMALAVWAAQTGRRKSTVGFLMATLVLGSAFLGIKAIEYSHKFHEHLVPGPHFQFEGTLAPQVEMFFNLYFMMTGLHALHMVVGAGLLIATAVLAWKGRFSPQNHNFVEGVGLYWHFVDIVWIFLFPLLYLLGRS